MELAPRRSTRARTGAQRAAQHNASECPLLELCRVPDYRDLLLRALDAVTMSALVLCKALRVWVLEIRNERRVTAVDVAAGVHVRVLRFLVRPLSAADCTKCSQPLVKSSELRVVDEAYTTGWWCDICNKNGSAGAGIARLCCHACKSDLCCECYSGHGDVPGLAVEDTTIRLVAASYDLGEGAPLRLMTKGMRLLGEDGVVITRAVNAEYVVHTQAGVAIEKVAVHSFTETNSTVTVQQGSATVKDCGLLGQVRVSEDAELLLQECTAHNSTTSAVSVNGIAVIQDCILQDSPVAYGIDVKPSGEVTITGTTIRGCDIGLLVNGKATIGKGCSIIDCVQSGVFAWKADGGPGEVTVEEDAGLVCEGNNTGNHPQEGEFVASFGGVIKGIAAEKLTRFE